MTVEEKRRELFESLYPVPSGVCFGGSGSYVVFNQPALLGAELSRREYNQLWGCFNKTLDLLATVSTAQGVKVFPERFPEGVERDPEWVSGYETGYNDGVDGFTKHGLWEVCK